MTGWRSWFPVLAAATLAVIAPACGSKTNEAPPGYFKLQIVAKDAGVKALDLCVPEEMADIVMRRLSPGPVNNVGTINLVKEQLAGGQYRYRFEPESNVSKSAPDFALSDNETIQIQAAEFNLGVFYSLNQLTDVRYGLTDPAHELLYVKESNGEIPDKASSVYYFLAPADKGLREEYILRCAKHDWELTPLGYVTPPDAAMEYCEVRFLYQPGFTASVKFGRQYIQDWVAVAEATRALVETWRKNCKDSVPQQVGAPQ